MSTEQHFYIFSVLSRDMVKWLENSDVDTNTLKALNCSLVLENSMFNICLWLSFLIFKMGITMLVYHWETFRNTYSDCSIWRWITELSVQSVQVLSNHVSFERYFLKADPSSLSRSPFQCWDLCQEPCKSGITRNLKIYS